MLGAMLVAGSADTPLLRGIGILAVVLGAANVFGGFVVTDRMLEMFKKKEGPPVASDGRKPGTGDDRRLALHDHQPQLRRRGAALHLRLAAAEQPANRALGKSARRGRDADRPRRDAARPEHPLLLGDRDRHRDRRGDRHLQRAPRADDGDAADGRALQRRRGRDRGARFDRRVPAASGHGESVGVGRRSPARSASHRRDLLHRQPGRLRQAAGDPSRRPLLFPGGTSSTPCSRSVALGLGGWIAMHSGARPRSGRCSASRSSSACWSCCRSGAATCRS